MRYNIKAKAHLPTTEHPTHFPRMGMPSASAKRREASTQIAAPSPTPLAFPAVVLLSPQPGKTPFKSAKDYEVTPFRIVSSTLKRPPLISTGIISSLNIPVN